MGYVPLSRRNKTPAKELGPLITAAACGWTKTIKVLINDGANVNYRTKNGSNALLYASTPQIAKLLLDAGADVNAARSDGVTALILAIANSPTPALVSTLLKAGANPNQISKYGDHPMHFAANRGLHYVKELLKAGAQLNPSNNSGENTVTIAASAGKTDIVAYCFRLGLKWTYMNRYGRSVIDELLVAGSSLAEISDDVLINHLMIRRSSCSITPCMRAAKRATKSGSIALKRLLSLGADVNEKSSTGYTALLSAVEQPENDMNINTLLMAGANVNHRSPAGLSCTYIASRSSNLLGVINLLLFGAPEVSNEEIAKLSHRMQVVWLKLKNLNNFERAVTTGHHIDHLESTPNTAKSTFDLLNWLVTAPMREYPLNEYPTVFVWSLECHHQCPQHIKDLVYTILLCMKKITPSLPFELTEIVFKQVPFFGGFYLKDKNWLKY